MKECGRKRRKTGNPAAFLHIVVNSQLLRVLKNDKRAIFTAAGYAEAAAAFLHGLQPEAGTVAEANDDSIRAAV